MEIPEDDICPIIFGRPFLNTAGASIDCKREVVSLKYGEEVREFHFSRFKNHPQPWEHDNNEEKTIAQLAAIYFGTPEDDLERSLTEYEKDPEDPAKEDIDHHLNETPVHDPVSSAQYEIPEERRWRTTTTWTKTSTKRVKVWVFRWN